MIFFVFSSLLLPAACPHPLIDETPGGRALQPTPIGRLDRCRGRAGRRRSPCTTIGRR
jgi:hypothetical protein